MKKLIVSLFACLAMNSLSLAYEAYISPSQRVGIGVGAYQQRGPNEKVFGSKMKSENFPALGVSYEYLYPNTWYVGGFLDWLNYRIGDSSSRYPETHFYRGEFHLGYTFYPKENLFLSTYVGGGRTKNRIKHKNVSIMGSKVSDGAFYFIREWWYPVVGAYLEARTSDRFSIGLRAQYMPMIRTAKGSCFAELLEDQVIIDDECDDLTAEKKYNFSIALPMTFYFPYTSSAFKITPFGVTFFNGRMLNEGKPISRRDICVYDVGLRFEYLYIF